MKHSITQLALFFIFIFSQSIQASNLFCTNASQHHKDSYRYQCPNGTVVTSALCSYYLKKGQRSLRPPLDIKNTWALCPIQKSGEKFLGANMRCCGIR